MKTLFLLFILKILKKNFVYSKISCDNTEFSSTFSSLVEKRDLTEAVKNSFFLKRHSNAELRHQVTAVTLLIQKTTIS